MASGRERTMTEYWVLKFCLPYLMISSYLGGTRWLNLILIATRKFPRVRLFELLILCTYIKLTSIVSIRYIYAWYWNGIYRPGVSQMWPCHKSIMNIGTLWSRLAGRSRACKGRASVTNNWHRSIKAGAESLNFKQQARNLHVKK
jgi:hypothetical protein